MNGFFEEVTKEIGIVTKDFPTVSIIWIFCLFQTNHQIKFAKANLNSGLKVNPEISIKIRCLSDSESINYRKFLNPFSTSADIRSKTISNESSPLTTATS